MSINLNFPCPSCGADNTKRIDGNSNNKGRVTRRRKCQNLDCLFTFTTIEEYRPDDIRNNEKLNMTQAEQIRETYAYGGKSQRQIAEQFGITQQMVSRIVKGTRWKRRGLDA